jgi:ABC-type phosphate transport system substrate-binding protein
LTVAALAAGCGGGNKSTAPQTTPPQPSTTTTGADGPTTSASGSQNPGALTAEAQQAAAGDIPDNQVFLTFADAQAGYSMKYPEGWAQRGTGGRVTFQDKNNLVRVTVSKGAGVSVAGAAAELNRLRQQTPSLRFDPPTQMSVSGKPVVKVVYSTESAPNSVTGKRVTLVVDRYYVPGVGKHAVVDLGTPQGVDNVDAYRLMIESFRWK